jgi:uncharacterized protein (DUF488 family)
VNTIYTLGYNGWKIEDVEAVLARLDAILVDVRMVPRTRWTPAWNSSVLYERLGDASAHSTGSSSSPQADSAKGRYVWLKEFGNKNYKGTFEQIEIADFRAGQQRLRELLAQSATVKAVVLMCGCRDVNICHRKVVAEKLAKEWDMDVCHLATPPKDVQTKKLF